ncbi:porin [Undibacterium arcticum]|uniref:Porin n=1 Tax=Undibacterium arcticum TaxID=1762892 RepID=A0ABV7F7J8_9BURK
MSKAIARILKSRGIAARFIFKLFTGALLASFAVGVSAQTNVEMFGVLSVGVADINNSAVKGVGGSVARVQSSLDYPSFIGFRGAEDLGDGDKAIFSLAEHVAVDTGVGGQGTSMFSKNAWVGLSSGTLGTIMIGRNDEFAPDQCSVTALCGNGLIFTLHPGNLDRIGGSQLASMVKYSSPNFGNFLFRSFYSFGNANATTNQGRAIGLESVYRTPELVIVGSYESLRGVTLSPLSANLGIGTTRLFNTPVTTATAFAVDKQDIYVLGGRYTVGNMSYTATFSDVVLQFRGVNSALKTLELGGTYKLSDPISITAGAYQSRQESSRWNTLGLTFTYSLSKRTNIYIVDGYQRVSGPNQLAQMFQAGTSSNSAQNVIATGIRHAF